MVPRFAAILFLALSATFVSALPERVPPLVEPANHNKQPGKIIWADLFSTEPNSSARFYGALFDWTSRTFADEGGKYVVLSSAGTPVAGVVRGPDRKDDRPAARWVAYFSSDNTAAAQTAVEASGGRVLAGPLNVPDRGMHVIAADAEGALFGLMDSTAGDPVDREYAEGELMWLNLFAYAPAQAAEFYAAVAGVGSEPWRSAGVHLTTGDGVVRAGISPLNRDTTATPTWVPFFKVGDMDRKLKLAGRLGAKLVVNKRLMENGSTVAVLVDTFGAVFALVQPEENAEVSP